MCPSRCKNTPTNKSLIISLIENPITIVKIPDAAKKLLMLTSNINRKQARKNEKNIPIRKRSFTIVGTRIPVLRENKRSQNT